MKLAAMDLENFRCFEKLHIEFDERLTVLVGANGAGKTAIIDAATLFLESYIYHFVDLQEFSTISKSDIRYGQDETSLYYQTVAPYDGFSVVDKLTFSRNNPDMNNCEFVLDFMSRVGPSSAIIPVVVRYHATRALDKFEQNPDESNDFKDAFLNAFNPVIDFSAALAWFIAKESEEGLKIKRTQKLDYKLADLSAVRAAISKALGDYNEPYADKTPPDLFITHKNAPDTPLTVRQLSDGYRTMLALIMDLTRRMAVANADAEWPEGQTVLHSPGIVLIDEVEQHLHPAWQQTVLPRLMDIFPNVQFIVTTHSPQVLTSIKAKHIRILDGGQVYDAPQGTWGAEASRLLQRVFGVDNRPPSPATDELNRYADLVYADQWDSDEARKLRGILDERYGQEEPMLTRLDLYIANRKWELAEATEEKA